MLHYFGVYALEFDQFAVLEISIDQNPVSNLKDGQNISTLINEGDKSQEATIFNYISK